MISILLAIAALPGSAHAEELLSMSTSLSGQTAPDTAPQTLSTARNIQLAIIQNTVAKDGDLLQRVRNGFAMPELHSPLIARHEQWYASRPEYMARMMSRASLYLYYITSEVERRGMPSEIALLPMIESAYNPVAYSTGSASGIWQFVPLTGKNFGLQQNWWYDGRRDVISATTGALDYLQKLHEMFGDWQLALAAYNWGEGSVSRAQERNRKLGLPTDYSSLKMPEQTLNYIPKLLAIKNIIANPKKFGLELPAIANEPYFASVSTAKHIDVKLAAQLAGITQEEFMALNPAHNRPVILQRNSDYILLPVDRIETFLNNLETYDKPLVSWQIYQTKKGEKLATLAPRFGLSVEKLQAANGMTAHSQLSSGDTLLIPLNSEMAANNEARFEALNQQMRPFQTSSDSSEASVPNPPGTTPIKHQVVKGETLSKIARRYGISLATLRSGNNQVKNIRVGQMLTIVKPATTLAAIAKTAVRTSARTTHDAARKYGKRDQTSTRKLASRKSGDKHASGKKNGKVNLAYQNK